MKILVAETKDFSEKVRAKLETLGELTFKDLQQEELQRAMSLYDVFWFRLGFQLDRKVLATPDRRVKIIVCPVTGLNHIDTQACSELGIKIISLKGETEFLKEVRATAEHTLGITLALIRNLTESSLSTRRGVWDREPFKGREIFGKKVGIIGLGRLGEITASYFQALGAEVVGYDINEVRSQVKQVPLEDLLKDSDIVSLHINYSEENVGFLDSSKIGLMKKGSIFINTARGMLVDEQALVDALMDGKLSGVASDVIEDEFNTDNSPLLKIANKTGPSTQSS